MENEHFDFGEIIKTVSEDNIREDVKSELYLLTYNFLISCELNNLAEIFKNELKDKKISYMRTDIYGATETVPFPEFIQLLKHRELPNSYLIDAFYGALKTIREDKTKPYHGVSSLISNRFPSYPIPKETFSTSPYSSYTNQLASILKMKYGEKNPSDDPKKSFFRNLRFKKRIVGHLASTYCVIFDRTGEAIITGSDDKLIKIWHSRTGVLVATLRGHQDVICDLSLTLDNSLLASCSFDKTVRLWSTEKAIELGILRGHSSKLSSVKFSPRIGNSIFLASTGYDAVVCFWKFTDGVYEDKPTKFCEKIKNTSQIMCSTFSPGGTFFVAGASDSIIHIYRMDDTIIKIADLDGHLDRVDSVDFNRYGDRFISTSADGIARIWTPHAATDWTSNELSPHCNLEQEGPVLSSLKIICVAWNLNSFYIIGSLNDFSIVIWNSQKLTPLHRLKKHTELIYVIDPHPFHPYIFLTAGHDGALIIWDLELLKPICELSNNILNHGHGAIYDAKFSPTEAFIAATDTHGHLCLFGTGFSEIYTRAPDEQFFMTDYRPIYIEDGKTYDEQTGLLTHEMMPPYLVKIDGSYFSFQEQFIHLGRVSPIFRRTLTKTISNSDKLNKSIVAGLRPASEIEGVRQIENIPFFLPIEQEDIDRWRSREIIRPLSEIEAHEIFSTQSLVEKHESEFYNSLKESTETGQSLEERKIKLISLKSKVINRRVENNPPPLIISPEPPEPSIESEASFSGTYEPDNSDESDTASVHREICTRRNRYGADSTEESSILSSPPPIISPFWWLLDKQTHFPYVPQSGDIVVYVLQAHKLYVNHVIKHKIHKISIGKLCFKRMALRPIEICRIKSVTFHSESSECIATLSKLDDSGTYSLGFEFNVRFVDIPNVDGFLVLKQFYDEAMKRTWIPGNHFRSLMDDTWWYGQVISVSTLSLHYPDSPFQSIQVKWSSGEEDRLSPWDMFGLNNEPEIYIFEEADWDPETYEEATQRIIAGLETAQLSPNFTNLQIALSVQSTGTFPCLNLCNIIKRCQNGFYRRRKQVICDLRMILHHIDELGLPSNVQRGAHTFLRTLMNFVNDVEFNVSNLVKDKDTLIQYSTESERRILEIATELKWVIEAQTLLNYISSLTDAQPFLKPVDTTIYPDYLSFVKAPMDLTTVSKKLHSGSYLTPNQFVSDMRLIFLNSKSYNTNRRSNIYNHTVRLYTLFNNKIESLLPVWEDQILKGKTRLTRHKITQFFNSIDLPGYSALEQIEFSPITNQPISQRLRNKNVQLSSSMDSSPEKVFPGFSNRKRSKLLSESFEILSEHSNSSSTIVSNNRRTEIIRKNKNIRQLKGMSFSSNSTFSNESNSTKTRHYNLRSNNQIEEVQDEIPPLKSLRKRRKLNYCET